MSRLAALCVSNAVWRAVKDHIWPKAHNFWCYVCDLTRLLVSRELHWRMVANEERSRMERNLHQLNAPSGTCIDSRGGNAEQQLARG